MSENHYTEKGKLQELIELQIGPVDTSTTLSNRDGSILERTEYIIDQLANSQPVKVIQSDSSQGILDVFSRFFATLLDINGNAWPSNEIDITGATILLEQSCNGDPFSSVGISQPILEKGAGFVAATTSFPDAEWDIDCIYRLTISGVEIHDGLNYNVPTMIWNNSISNSTDMDTEIDFIVTAVTLPGIDDIENTTTAHAVGNKLDTVAGTSLFAGHKRMEAQGILIKTETDKIPTILTETNKIASIKTTVEAITGYALDSTVAKDATVAKAATVALDATVAKSTALTTVGNNVLLVKTETDKIPATITKIDAIKVETDKISATITKIDEINTNTQLNSQRVYPTLADGIVVTGAGAWVLGANVTLVPSNTIVVPFKVIGVNVASMSANDTYYLEIYSGTAGNEVLIGSTRFTKVANSNMAPINIFTDNLPANTRISAKIATSTGNDNATISIQYLI